MKDHKLEQALQRAQQRIQSHWHVVGFNGKIYVTQGDYGDDYEYFSGPYSSERKARKWANSTFPDGTYVQLNNPLR